MKIEFGAGENPTPGFISSDIRAAKGVRYVCPCWEAHEEIKNNSVEVIKSRHMFEHLTFKQGEMTLSSWYKILKSGGKVHLCLPDLHYHVREYLKYFENRKISYNEKGNVETPSFIHSIAGFYGWQKEHTQNSKIFTANENNWCLHKSGYDEISLRDLCEQHGYINFKRLKSRASDLEVVFFKP